MLVTGEENNLRFFFFFLWGVDKSFDSTKESHHRTRHRLLKLQ